MTVEAKELLKGKFWIVEEDGRKTGTISVSDDRYVYCCHSGPQFFKNIKQFKKIVGSDVTWSVATKDKNVDKDVNGYPTSCTPYNPVFDVKKKLPLFTKSDKSKSLYCAGYYIIKFDKGWVKSFCPKLITVERYESRGPFKSEIEMKQELSIVNKKSN
jgi:hypothetical protein